MMKKSAILIVAAALTMATASQALAQSFNPRDGTGNVLPLQYGADGSRTPYPGAFHNAPLAIPQAGQGLYDYVAPQGARLGHHRR
jgi:opacity protein-like surface antigen